MSNYHIRKQVLWLHYTFYLKTGCSGKKKHPQSFFEVSLLKGIQMSSEFFKFQYNTDIKSGQIGVNDLS